MLNKNKNIYCIHFILRKKKFFKAKKTYDIVLAKKSRHNKFFVIEKLGSLDFNNNKIHINFFRLVFWLQFNPSITATAWKYLEKYVFNFNW